MTASTIEVLDLSGRHIGRNVSVTDSDGWVHTGTLVQVQHESRASYIRQDSPPWAWLRVKSANGSQWMGRIESMVTLEEAS